MGENTAEQKASEVNVSVLWAWAGVAGYHRIRSLLRQGSKLSDWTREEGALRDERDRFGPGFRGAKRSPQYPKKRPEEKGGHPPDF
ncbi:unnamed protein product [Effrenium voratum]|nr:unnamed protein product [Effrenium voratum]